MASRTAPFRGLDLLPFTPILVDPERTKTAVSLPAPENLDDDNTKRYFTTDTPEEIERWKRRAKTWWEPPTWAGVLQTFDGQTRRCFDEVTGKWIEFTLAPLPHSAETGPNGHDKFYKPPKKAGARGRPRQTFYKPKYAIEFKAPPAKAYRQYEAYAADAKRLPMILPEVNAKLRNGEVKTIYDATTLAEKYPELKPFLEAVRKRKRAYKKWNSKLRTRTTSIDKPIQAISCPRCGGGFYKKNGFKCGDCHFEWGRYIHWYEDKESSADKLTELSGVKYRPPDFTYQQVVAYLIEQKIIENANQRELQKVAAVVSNLTEGVSYAEAGRLAGMSPVALRGRRTRMARQIRQQDRSHAGNPEIEARREQGQHLLSVLLQETKDPRQILFHAQIGAYGTVAADVYRAMEAKGEFRELEAMEPIEIVDTVPELLREAREASRPDTDPEEDEKNWEIREG